MSYHDSGETVQKQLTTDGSPCDIRCNWTKLHIPGLVLRERGIRDMNLPEISCGSSCRETPEGRISKVVRRSVDGSLGADGSVVQGGARTRRVDVEGSKGRIKNSQRSSEGLKHASSRSPHECQLVFKVEGGKILLIKSIVDDFNISARAADGRLDKVNQVAVADLKGVGNHSHAERNVFIHKGLNHCHLSESEIPILNRIESKSYAAKR